MINEIKRQSLADYIGGSQEKAGRAVRVNPCPLCGHSDCFTIFESNTYKCFSCGRSGSIIDYVIDKGLAGDVAGAVEVLGRHFKINRKDDESTFKRQNDASTIKREEIERVFQIAAEHYHTQLLSSKKAMKYLQESRQRSDRMINDENYGFAPTRMSLTSKLTDKKVAVETQLASGLVCKGEDGRLYDLFGNGQIIYPVYMAGKVCDFQAKPIDKEKGHACQLRKENKLRNCLFYGQDGLYRDEWILVEGPEDRNAILQLGNYNAVAILGSLSNEQIQYLAERAEGKRIWLCFDSDAAGEKYTEKLGMVLSGPARVEIIDLGEHKDIDDWAKAGGSEEEFRELLATAKDMVSWKLGKLPERDLNPYEFKANISPIVSLIANEPDGMTRTAYLDSVQKVLKAKPRMISAITKAVKEKMQEGTDCDDDVETGVARKGTQYVKITNDNFKIISDFVMDIIRYIEDDGVRYYEVILHTAMGSSKPVILSNEQRIVTRLFDAALSAMGPYYFYGSLNDLKEVWQLEEERADIKSYTCRFNRYGWIKDHKIWLFDNCAYKDGKLYLPEADEEVIVIDGIGYQSSNVRVYGGDKPTLDLEAAVSREYVQQVIDNVWDMWDAGHNGKCRSFRGFLAMGYMAACVYLPEITAKENKFPYLLAFGPPGTGKSEAMQFVMNMWGFRNGGENWGEATPAGISMAMEQLSSVPYWIEEFSNTMGASHNQQRKVELLKNVYNRVSSGKGGLQGRTVYQVNAAMFMTGQDRPENQALLSRCVVLRKESPTEAGSAGYMKLKAEGKKLTMVLRWLLENKSSDSVKQYFDNFNRLMTELKTRVKAKVGDYNERTAVNIAIIATGFSLYGYHAHDTEFLNWLVDECALDMTRKQAEDIVYRFFCDIETIFQGDMLRVVQRTENEVYLLYSVIYNEWVKNLRSTGMNEYIGREGLLDYLKKDTHDYWIEPSESKGHHRRYFEYQGKHIQARCIGIRIDNLPQHIKEIVEGWDISIKVI